ncbi:chemotaxis protein CheX [Bacterioplanes sanyensis]|uniref:Chemotaxis protein CheX n=1 Tax=Bacterioplanes sanyensis TaxID=1249553 RepID=A0A222FNL7_9GAMM|nr:chemotaxis protein CheX [Bacterioplanes sanyensis]ASP40114.1 chemotaxis protein CheX [Bacterioplanes sanyensis]
MKADYINPFIETIQHILTTMASMTCGHGKPFLKDDSCPLGDVTGLIAMNGDSVEGSLAISFSASAIQGITSAMLGETVEELDDSCTSLTGELTNMLSGGARKLLWERGYSFEMATPRLLQGDAQINHYASAQVIVIPFDSKHGDFFIEVALQPKLQTAALHA